MTCSFPRRWLLLAAVIVAASAWFLTAMPGTGQPAPRDLAGEYAKQIRPLMQKYCLTCHSTKVHKGDLDLERFASLDAARKDLHAWQMVSDQLEIGEMPPKGKPQPDAAERKLLLGWVRGMLDAEARARAGDPGRTLLRRLNNAEYTNTIRDLTGVDLNPAREFPPDSAAGEGFTNTGETLVMSPALIDRYLKAARDVAAHAVLLPDGFRFSRSAGRRDWAAEVLADVRKEYAAYGPDGKLPLLPYIDATLRHRDALTAGKMTLDQAAAQEKLSPKYLHVLWQTLNDKEPSSPLDTIRAQWRAAGPKDAAAVTASISAWQASLWKAVFVGSYVDSVSSNPRESMMRQVARDPAFVESVPLRLAVKPAPGQSEVVLSLVARDITSSDAKGNVVWQRPRLESKKGPPRPLRDYATFGPVYEIDFPAVFRDADKYLAAVAEAAHERKSTVDELAKKHALDAALLRRWVDLTAVQALTKQPVAEPAFDKATTPLTLLDERTPKNEQRPAINGWRGKGAELPVLVTNASDRVQMIPGTARPHKVMVHPMPKEFVAVSWTSPVAGTVRVEAHIIHAHPACGNGIAFWLEHRRAEKAATVAEGAADRGGEARVPSRSLKVEKGDQLVLAIDARNGDHTCDLTEIAFTVTEDANPGRSWGLAADVADTVQAGNPHADRHGNKEVWTFVKGPSRPVAGAKTVGGAIPPGSLLARWREAAADPARQPEAAKLAGQVQALLSGPRPMKKDADAALYDALLAPDGPFMQGLDPARLPRLAAGKDGFGLMKERFDDANLIVPVNSVTPIRLPAALLRDHEFVVEGKLAGSGGVVQFTVAPTAVPLPDARWDGTSPLVAAPGSPAVKRLLDGSAKFREVFPMFICFPKVVPDDNTVCLKMYHREDEPLLRLMLDDTAARKLDRLWAELRFISRQPVAENDYLPQFIGYTTQDTPKELQKFFIDRKPLFKKKADDFRAEEEKAAPAQLQALIDFADRAYRRPLKDFERKQLLDQHAALRKKGVGHDEAFRSVLTRVFASPHFLYRVEMPPAGTKPGPISDLELATRLSYFLWATTPDGELCRLAQEGKLRDPKALTAQTERMLKAPRVRGLATEFGMQWLLVRDILEHKEKSEKLFPTFDDKLRQAFFDESALLFADLFTNDRPVLDLIDGDDLFVNETLAKHYGLTGVKGDWQKRPGARKLGRGGVLTLSAVLTKQAGASRTSPILRGNWVVQTLLGEKLPRPPADVPQLPEAEDTSKLSVRQLVEQHVRDARCAGCHRRIDPFGFALEGFDPIGRRRDMDLAGRPVDTKAMLTGGITLDGVDGLRRYLLKERRDDFLRTFCRKLLGYALGRSLTLADQPLVDDMMQSLRTHDYRVSAAILPVVQSPQFRYLRGSEMVDEQ